MKFLRFAFLIGYFTLANRATGCAHLYQNLLNMRERPGMQSVRSFILSCPEMASQKALESFRTNELKQNDSIPHFIASLEKAFPDGRYYFLGRDSAYLNDIVQSFYLSLGAWDRAYSLNVSHPSFRSDEKLVPQFLRDRSVFFKYFLVNGGRSSVILDTTSFSRTSGVGGGASQSVRLVKAGYDLFRQIEKSDHISLTERQKVELFNFVSIGGGSFPGLPITDFDFDPEKALDEQARNTDEWGFKTPLHCNLYSFTYTPEWNQIYQPFEVVTGQVISKPGPLADIGQREQILREMITVAYITSDPMFHKAVQAAALIRGYQFPFAPPKPGRSKKSPVSYISHQQRDTVRAEYYSQVRPVSEPKKEVPSPEKDLENSAVSQMGADLLYRLDQLVKEEPENIIRVVLEALVAGTSLKLRIEERLTASDVYEVVSALVTKLTIKDFKRGLSKLNPPQIESLTILDVIFESDVGNESSHRLKKRALRNISRLRAFLSGEKCQDRISYFDETPEVSDGGI